MKLKHAALDLIELFEQTREEYRETNRHLRTLQGDFYTHVQEMDESLETQLVSLLDQILGGDSASYYLYELPIGGGARYDGEKKWEIKTVNDLRAYVFREEV